MADNGDKSSRGWKERFFDCAKTTYNKFFGRNVAIKKNHITREPLQLGLCVICENTATREIIVEDSTFSLCKIHHTDHEKKPFTLPDMKREVPGNCSADEKIEAVDVLGKTSAKDPTKSGTENVDTKEAKASSGTDEGKNPTYINKF